jgi:hypothetical protein
MRRATAGTVAVAVGGMGVAVGVAVAVGVRVDVAVGGSGVGEPVLTETTRVSGGKLDGVAAGWAQAANNKLNAQTCQDLLTWQVFLRI